MLPSGVYNVNYQQSMAVLRTKAHWSLLVLFLIALFAAPLYVSRYFLTLISIIAFTVVAVQGLNILTGLCGQISVGQSAFVGIGAYAFVIMSNSLHMSFPLALLCSGLISGIVGVVVGLPAVRIKGFYLAMATLGAQLIIGWLFLNWRSMTGGTGGVFLDQATFLGFDLQSKAGKYYTVLSISLMMVFFAKNIMRSKVGRAFVAIRDNDLAASLMGINLITYKSLAFFLACFFAGIAGVLFALQISYVSPLQFTLNESIIYLAMLIAGGMGSVMGPIFGVIFIKLLEEVTLIISPIVSEMFPVIGAQASGALLLMLYASIVLVFLIFEPRGINHRWTIFKNQYRLYPFGSL